VGQRAVVVVGVHGVVSGEGMVGVEVGVVDCREGWLHGGNNGVGE
jgi:hypothetical protein